MTRSLNEIAQALEEMTMDSSISDEFAQELQSLANDLAQVDNNASCPTCVDFQRKQKILNQVLNGTIRTLAREGVVDTRDVLYDHQRMEMMAHEHYRATTSASPTVAWKGITP